MTQIYNTHTHTPVAPGSAGLHDVLKGKMKKETENLELNHGSSSEIVNYLETNTQELQ